MKKSLDDYVKEWEDNAQADALYVILTDSRYYGRKWGIEEFFFTGEEEIQRIFTFMERQTITFSSGSFLDFGCGVGRNSKALRKRFMKGYGVDISQKMIGLAQNYVPEVQFSVNQTDSLEEFKNNSFDFVYSHIVLQHIPNRFQSRYIEEIFRVLKPEGIAVVQIPIEIINIRETSAPLSIRIRRKVKKYFPVLVKIKRWMIPPKSFSHEFRYEMHAMPDHEFRALCAKHGCIIEAAPATNSCERDHNGKIEFYDLYKYRKRLKESGILNSYLSCMYFVRKPMPNTTNKLEVK